MKRTIWPKEGRIVLITKKTCLFCQEFPTNRSRNPLEWRFNCSRSTRKSTRFSTIGIWAESTSNQRWGPTRWEWGTLSNRWSDINIIGLANEYYFYNFNRYYYCSLMEKMSISWSLKTICWLKVKVLLSGTRHKCFCGVCETLSGWLGEDCWAGTSVLGRTVSSDLIDAVYGFVVSRADRLFSCDGTQPGDLWHFDVGEVSVSGTDVVFCLAHFLVGVGPRSRILTRASSTLAVLSISLSGSRDLKAGALKSLLGRLL